MNKLYYTAYSLYLMNLNYFFCFTNSVLFITFSLTQKNIKLKFSVYYFVLSKSKAGSSVKNCCNLLHINYRWLVVFIYLAEHDTILRTLSIGQFFPRPTFGDTSSTIFDHFFFFWFSYFSLVCDTV